MKKISKNDVSLTFKNSEFSITALPVAKPSALLGFVSVSELPSAVADCATVMFGNATGQTFGPYDVGPSVSCITGMITPPPELEFYSNGDVALLAAPMAAGTVRILLHKVNAVCVPDVCVPVHVTPEGVDTRPAARVMDVEGKDCPRNPMIGYHNMEQFRQCARQARDKFFALKASGLDVPRNSKRPGDSVRLALKAVVQEAAGAGMAHAWYMEHTSSPDAPTLHAVDAIAPMILHAVRDVERLHGISPDSPEWCKLVDECYRAPMVRHPALYREPFGGKVYDLAVSPDVLWLNPGARVAVMLEVKCSSNPTSRAFYLEKSDQLLWYAQVLRTAGWKVAGAYMLLLPSPAEPFALSLGRPPLTPVFWEVNTSKPAPAIMELNRTNWAALFEMISANYEQQAAWPHTPGPWCDWCDCSTACPSYKPG